MLKNPSKQAVLALGLFAALVQGCAEDPEARRGQGGSETRAHPSDSEHPGWRLHPDALVLDHENVNAVYDVRVSKDELRLPRAGYEALVGKIVAGRTILVSRANEDDAAKNEGFVRGILSVTTHGDEVVMTTKTLSLANIVLGHLALGGADRPRFVLPGTRKKNAGGAALSARTDKIEAPIVAQLLNEKRALTVGVQMDVAKFALPKSKTLDVKGSASVTFDTELFLEVGLTGGIDYGLADDFCIPVFLPFLGLNAGCVGIPEVTGDLTLVTSYEFSVRPTVELNGSISTTIPLPEFSLTSPACTIFGLPCFVKGGFGGAVNLTLNGSAKFTTDKPFRFYGINNFGATVGKGGIPLPPPLPPVLFHAGGSMPTIEGPTLGPEGFVPQYPSAVFEGPTDAPKLTIMTRMAASIEYGPLLQFGLGAPELANINGTAKLREKIGAEAALCYDVVRSAFSGPIRKGGAVKAGPEISSTFGVALGPVSASATQPLFSAYETLFQLGDPNCGGVEALPPPDKFEGGGSGGGGGGAGGGF